MKPIHLLVCFILAVSVYPLPASELSEADQLKAKAKSLSCLIDKNPQFIIFWDEDHFSPKIDIIKLSYLQSAKHGHIGGFFEGEKYTYGPLALNRRFENYRNKRPSLAFGLNAESPLESLSALELYKNTGELIEFTMSSSAKRKQIFSTAAPHILKIIIEAPETWLSVPRPFGEKWTEMVAIEIDKLLSEETTVHDFMKWYDDIVHYGQLSNILTVYNPIFQSHNIISNNADALGSGREFIWINIILDHICDILANTNKIYIHVGRGHKGSFDKSLKEIFPRPIQISNAFLPEKSIDSLKERKIHEFVSERYSTPLEQILRATLDDENAAIKFESVSHNHYLLAGEVQSNHPNLIEKRPLILENFLGFYPDRGLFYVDEEYILNSQFTISPVDLLGVFER